MPDSASAAAEPLSAAPVPERLERARNICELFEMCVAERPDEVALRLAGGGLDVTWREYGERSARIAAGLAALGIGRGDTVAMMLLNRPEFALVDCAAMRMGATPYSIYNTFPPETIRHLLANAGTRVVVCEERFLEPLRAALPGTPVEHLVCVEPGVEGTSALAELEASGAGAPGPDVSAIEPDDVLTLIYTSGTTGPPKGVELTHGSMLAELRGTAQALPSVPGGCSISYLPAAHIADRWLAQYSAMVFGTRMTYLPDPAGLAAALVEVRPTDWGGVPRVWEKLRAGLEAGIAADPDEARRAAVRAAIDVGLRAVRLEQAGEPLGDELESARAQAEEHVFAPLRARIGLDRAETLVVGAAPSPRDLLEFFAAIGLHVLELWGMSETSCVVTTNRNGANRIGTVGQAIPGAEVRIADDGELLVRGPLLMRGYRGQPDRTAETIDADGWLHSGDIGQIDADGFVSIVDRKKELIINSAGKNMSPANIEAQLKAAHPLIGQAVCVGDRRPYNVALLVLEPEAAATWAREHGLEGASLQELAADGRVQAEIAQAVERANGSLARVEQIKRHRLLSEEWLPGGVELTPTMKLRRGPISERYAAELDALYDG